MGVSLAVWVRPSVTKPVLKGSYFTIQFSYLAELLYLMDEHIYVTRTHLVGWRPRALQISMTGRNRTLNRKRKRRAYL